MIKKHLDSIGRKIKVGDKILHYRVLCKRLRAVAGTITRVTDQSICYCAKGQEKYHKEQSKLFETRVYNFGSIIKYNWERNKFLW